MNRYFLSVESDGIKVHLNKKHIGLITSMEELTDILVDNGYNEGVDIVLCSSSLDFPKEYTNKKKIIKLCDEIRG